MLVKEMSSRMLKAIKNGNLDVLETMDLSVLDEQHQNALFYAIRQRSLKVVNFLLSKGCNKEQKNVHGQTPLHVAASLGDTKIITSLIEADVAINISDSKGRTPLMIAAAKGPLETVDLLLDFGAEPHHKDNLDQHLGFYAVRSKKIKIFTRALELGNTPHAFNKHHENLHHQVARYGLKTMQTHLFDLKVTPYIINMYRQSPLHLAAKRGDELMIDSYLQYGLPTYLKDTFNLNPKDYAQDYGEIMTIFERFETHPYIAKAFKQQPLHRALRKGSLDEAEALLRMGYQIDDKDFFGNKPLFYILLNKDELLLRLCLKRVHDIKDIDKFGRDAVFYAALLEHTSFFDVYDIKKDALDDETQTILERSEKLNHVLK